ncbi:MAG: alkaline phosphatase PhoX, partial [Planctomycetota bacterium]
VTVAPNGHLIVCEDGGKREDCLIGVSPDGECYRVAANRLSRSELAGAAFSPDGSTLFVNIQQDGLTLAIRGPWHV